MSYDAQTYATDSYIMNANWTESVFLCLLKLFLLLLTQKPVLVSGI